MDARRFGGRAARPELEHVVSYTVLALIGMLAGFMVGYVIGHDPGRASGEPRPTPVPCPRSLQSGPVPGR